MSDRDDRNLIRRCLQGDTDAFGLLIDRYQGLLFNTALRMTGDYEEAKDITQNTFVKAYERLNTYKPEHKFFSWIYRMLVNDSINSLKRSRIHQALNPALASTKPTPDEFYRQSEENLRVQRALIQLPFDSRMVIVLHYFNDMPYQEMGDILNLDTRTVKSRLYTARHRLAVILGEKGIMPHDQRAIHRID